jgi:hypothetical protein
VLTVPARESFKAVMREYKKSPAWGSDDRAHLQRWINDDRAEQVWDKIQCAARKTRLPFERRMGTVAGGDEVRRVARPAGRELAGLNVRRSYVVHVLHC